MKAPSKGLPTRLSKITFDPVLSDFLISGPITPPTLPHLIPYNEEPLIINPV